MEVSGIDSRVHSMHSLNRYSHSNVPLIQPTQLYGSPLAFL